MSNSRTFRHWICSPGPLPTGNDHPVNGHKGNQSSIYTFDTIILKIPEQQPAHANVVFIYHFARGALLSLAQNFSRPVTSFHAGTVSTRSFGPRLTNLKETGEKHKLINKNNNNFNMMYSASVYLPDVCLVDCVTYGTYLLLNTMTSRRNDWTRIFADAFLVSPWWPDRSRDWTELTTQYPTRKKSSRAWEPFDRGSRVIPQ